MAAPVPQSKRGERYTQAGRGKAGLSSNPYRAIAALYSTQATVKGKRLGLFFVCNETQVFLRSAVAVLIQPDPEEGKR